MDHWQPQRAPDHGAMMAVVSGDSEGPSDDEDIFATASDAGSTNDRQESQPEGESDPNQQGDDLLYDERMDEEDEKYVYMNLRGGKHDQQQPTQNPSANGAGKKPRNSDAILSCPCCFRILTLDTQKHCKYPNQFRAMFVMGISVDWEHTLKYDDRSKGLVRWYHPPPNNPNPSATQIVAPDRNPKSQQEEEDPIYYAVSCANCQTMVAALDMSDEVYHFYDCLVSY